MLYQLSYASPTRRLPARLPFASAAAYLRPNPAPADKLRTKLEDTMPAPTPQLGEGNRIQLQKIFTGRCGQR